MSPVSKQPIIAAVIGEPRSGKTTALLAIAEELSRLGFQAGGVTQPAVYNGEKRVGYDLKDMATGQMRVFAKKRPGLWPKGKGFSFDSEALDWASERILQARKTMELVIVDELGVLESHGDGHLKALLTPVDTENSKLWLLGVRDDCADAIQDYLGPFDFSLKLGSAKNKIWPSALEIREFSELLKRNIQI